MNWVPPYRAVLWISGTRRQGPGWARNFRYFSAAAFSWLQTSVQLFVFQLKTRRWKGEETTSPGLELGLIFECYWPLEQISLCFVQWGEAKEYFYPKSVCSLIHVRETAVHISDGFLSQCVTGKAKTYPQLIHPWVWLCVACLLIPDI